MSAVVRSRPWLLTLIALAVLVALLTFVLVYLLGRWLQWSPTAALAAPQSPTSRAESG